MEKLVSPGAPVTFSMKDIVNWNFTFTLLEGYGIKVFDAEIHI